MIIVNKNEAVWVVVGLGVASQKIEKHMLNFEAMAWWTLDRQRICPTTGDNILNPIHAALIARLMVRYEFDVG